jgi:3-hydroxyisobutyrate dehydrogenase-like beta-hydroxyacid dehydrogenase
MTTVGFVGLGSMGAPIAGRLLQGSTVYGTNRTKAKAERGGIDRALAVRSMSESPIGSPMLQARAPLILDLPGQAWFDVQLMHKDIRLALEAARAVNAPLPAASVADSILSRAEEMGYGHRDIAGLFQVLAARPAEPATAARPYQQATDTVGAGSKAT